MARFEMQLPTDLIKDFENLNKNSVKMFEEMTRAGAEVAASKIKANVPIPEMASHVKLTKTYRTPSDDGINTKVYFSGYLPFSNPNRKYFSRRGRQGGAIYSTEKGVPVDFLAQVFEYGRSTYPFPKKPFVRKSFMQQEITKVMLEVQGKYIEAELPF